MYHDHSKQLAVVRSIQLHFYCVHRTKYLRPFQSKIGLRTATYIYHDIIYCKAVVFDFVTTMLYIVTPTTVRGESSERLHRTSRDRERLAGTVDNCLNYE